MKIAHLYYVDNGNWGDVALGYVTRKLFDSFLGKQEYEIVTICNRPIPDMVKQINKNDCLLIGGGGLILFLGAFVNQTNLLKDIKVPIIVYGVGFNSFREANQEVLYRKQLLQILKDRAIFISIRCDGSAKKIKRDTGIEIQEGAPPATWASNFYDYDRMIDDKYVLISLANDLQKHRNVNEKVLQKKMGQICEKYAQHYKLIQINHRRDDANVKLPHIYKSFDGWNDEDAHLLSLYQHSSFVIAMRGHAQIFAFSYGVPCVSISTQDKIRDYAKEVDINNYELNSDFMDDFKVYHNSIRQIIIKDGMWVNTCKDFEKIKEKLT